MKHSDIRTSHARATTLGFVAALCAIAGCTTKNDSNTINATSGGAGQTMQSPISGSGGSAAAAGSGGSGSAANPMVDGSGGSTSMGMGMGTGSGGAPGSSSGSGGATQQSMGDAGEVVGNADAGAACGKDLTAMPGQDECTAPLKPMDDRLCKYMFNGAMRQFYIYASPAFDPCKPASLIMDNHGLSESAEVHTGKEGFNLNGDMFPAGYGSGMRMAVQRDNAIVVTPQGVDDSWDNVADVAFLNDAADKVEAIADVDPNHVYVTGISMGGMMTVATGCDDANRWRGMAPVSMLSQSCGQLAHPTPVISFHASTDQLTSYSDDQTLMGTIAGFNHCTMGPTPEISYGGANSSPDAVCYVSPNGVGDPDAPDPYHIPLQACPSSAPESTCVKWTGCDDGVEVMFCTVAASSQPLGGHILYNNDTQLNLAEIAWPFFKKFWQ